jgi:hypothetical protein
LVNTNNLEIGIWPQLETLVGDPLEVMKAGNFLGELKKVKLESLICTEIRMVISLRKAASGRQM